MNSHVAPPHFPASALMRLLARDAYCNYLKPTVGMPLVNISIYRYDSHGLIPFLSGGVSFLTYSSILGVILLSDAPLDNMICLRQIFCLGSQTNCTAIVFGALSPSSFSLHSTSLQMFVLLILLFVAEVSIRTSAPKKFLCRSGLLYKSCFSIDPLYFILLWYQTDSSELEAVINSLLLFFLA